jgi:hypothetical protein
LIWYVDHKISLFGLRVADKTDADLLQRSTQTKSNCTASVENLLLVSES